METKHTRGEWNYDINESKSYDIFITGTIKTIATVIHKDVSYMPNELEAEANAKLITEAGNVANETGKTPRQLASENQELLNALIVVKDLFKGHQDYLASKGQNVSTIMADKINRLIDIVVDKVNK